MICITVGPSCFWCPHAFPFHGQASLSGFEADPYFQKINLSLEARRRIYGQAAVLWYLVQKIGPSSDWIKKVADLVDSKPALAPCPFTAMGLPDESGFPREQFGIVA